MQYSTTQATNLVTYAGLIVLVAGKFFNVSLGIEEVTTWLGALITLVGTTMNWIHRKNKGDISAGGFRKFY